MLTKVTQSFVEPSEIAALVPDGQGTIVVLKSGTKIKIDGMSPTKVVETLGVHHLADYSD